MGITDTESTFRKRAQDREVAKYLKSKMLNLIFVLLETIDYHLWTCALHVANSCLA